MKKNKIVLLTIVFCIIIVILVTLTSAKYAYNSVWNYYLHSRGFYFESDLLEVETKKNSILTWNGSDVMFSLTNSENNGLISEYDISYKISCEVLGDEKEYLDCVLNNTGKSSLTGTLTSIAKCVDNKTSLDVSALTKSKCELSGYTWVNEISKKENYFNVVLKDATKNINEVSVKVVVETTSPYKKELSGIFNLNLVENENEYNVDYQSYTEYDELIIINKTYEKKCFVIEFSTDAYVVNESDSIISYEGSVDDKINKIKIQTDQNNSSGFKFYKTNSEANYSIENFIIEESEC